MIGNVPSSAGPVNGHLPGAKDIGLLPAPADREEMGVLGQEKDIGESLTLLYLHEPLLEGECRMVIHLA